MAKLNKPAAKTTVAKGPLKITSKQGTTHEGAAADLYGRKSELFMLAVSTFGGEAGAYRSAEDRDARMRELATHVALRDPDWIKRFLPWLRGEANMRTSAITMAVDAAYAFRHLRIEGGRQLINSVLSRADEPADALAYAINTYGHNLPMPVKRGIADAATRLYNEYGWLKWDSSQSQVRFADVLELTHPRATSFPGQSALFKYIIDARHGRDVDLKSELFQNSLPTIYNNKLLKDHIAAGTWREWMNPTTLRVAGMSWEDILSALGGVADKKELWEALIPTMGYMALLRNLRNFEQAGIRPDIADAVSRRLANADEVAKSKQLPMRFLSAYRALLSDQFRYGVDQGLHHSLNNIPQLEDRTLILIDTSGSMEEAMSDKSGLRRWDAAVIFGLALAARCQRSTVVSFSQTSNVFPQIRGESLLRGMMRWRRDGFFYGQGTYTRTAVDDYYANHDRIVILTDEQSHQSDVFASVPDAVRKYTINLAGYQPSHASKSTKNHATLSGLNDQMFKLIPLLEAQMDGGWPF